MVAFLQDRQRQVSKPRVVVLYPAVCLPNATRDLDF
jgi:hypothetical protein